MSDNEDLHGNAPDKSSAALLLIDVISDFEKAAMRPSDEIEFSELTETA